MPHQRTSPSASRSKNRSKSGRVAAERIAWRLGVDAAREAVVALSPDAQRPRRRLDLDLVEPRHRPQLRVAGLGQERRLDALEPRAHHRMRAELGHLAHQLDEQRLGERRAVDQDGVALAHLERVAAQQVRQRGQSGVAHRSRILAPVGSAVNSGELSATRAPRRGSGRRRTVTGSSATRPVSRSVSAMAARAASSSIRFVFSATATTGRRAHVAGHAHVVVDQLGQVADREARVAVDQLAARLVHEHERVRRRAVQQAERDARVGRVVERALALDPQDRAVAAAARGPRRRAPRRRRRRSRTRPGRRRSPTRRSRCPVWPVGTNTDASPRRRASRSSSRQTVILPEGAVGPDREHRVGGDVEVRAGGNVEAVGDAAQVAQRDAGQGGRVGDLGVLGQELVQAALDVEPELDRPQDAAPEDRRQLAARGRDADQERRRAVAPSPRRCRRRPGTSERSPGTWSDADVPARVESITATVGDSA